MRLGRFLLSLALILTGVIFLLFNLGYSSWWFLQLLPYFCPILLILIGLSLLWKGRIPIWFALLLIVILVAAVMAFILTSSPQENDTFFAEERFSISPSDHPLLSLGELDISFGAGRLYLGAGSEDWFEGEFAGLTPEKKETISQDLLRLKLEAEKRLGEDWLRYHDWRVRRDRRRGLGPSDIRWNLKLSPRLPWKISIEAGAFQGRFDLEGIPLTQFFLKSGAGDLEVKMGHNGPHSKLKIDAGLSRLRLLLPRDAGVNISLHGALAETNLEKMGFLVRNQRYISPNYETSTEKIDLDLNLALGQFELEWITEEDIAYSYPTVNSFFPAFWPLRPFTGLAEAL